MNKIILSLITCLPLQAIAITVDNEAGTLGGRVAPDDYDITELVVTGTIDAADFHFISNKLTRLKTIDLSGATISSYSGERVLTGATEYSADELPAFAFMGLPLESIKLPANLMAIGEGAFASTTLTSIAFPENLQKIGAHAFSSCASLESVSVPSKVAEIGQGAFADCGSLTEAELVCAITDISDYMFDGCGKLESVNLPASVKRIGTGAFRANNSLTTISFPSEIEVIADKAFMASGLCEADLSRCESLDSIGAFSFAQCGDLETVAMARPAILGQGVFFDDDNLRDFLIPTGIDAIPNFAFKGTSRIDPTNVLAEGTATIGNYALTGWSGISDIELPETLSYIGDGAMEGWSKLDTINAANVREVPKLGSNVWADVDQPNVTLVVHPEDVDSYRSADQWRNFKITPMQSTSAENITDDRAGGVEVGLGDGQIIIKSTVEPIAEIMIYGVDGKLLIRETADSRIVRIDAAGYASRVLLVKTVLKDHTDVTFKVQL